MLVSGRVHSPIDGGYADHFSELQGRKKSSFCSSVKIHKTDLIQKNSTYTRSHFYILNVKTLV